MKNWEKWLDKFQADKRERSREAFKKGFSDSKNTEESDDSKQAPTPSPTKEKIDATTQWATLYRLASSSLAKPAMLKKGDKFTLNLGDELLNAAFNRAVKLIRQSLQIDNESIQQELLTRLAQNSVARSSAVSTVRFMHGAQTAWFTECDFCGHDNAPPWDKCEKCSRVRE